MFCSKVLIFNIRHVWGTVGPKNVGKLASFDGRITVEKYVETLQDNLFQGKKAVLGKKASHSSSDTSMQPLTNQYLSKLT